MPNSYSYTYTGCNNISNSLFSITNCTQNIQTTTYYNYNSSGLCSVVFGSPQSTQINLCAAGGSGVCGYSGSSSTKFFNTIQISAVFMFLLFGLI